MTRGPETNGVVELQDDAGIEMKTRLGAAGPEDRTQFASVREEYPRYTHNELPRNPFDGE